MDFESIAREFVRLGDEERAARLRGDTMWAIVMMQQAAGMSFVINRLDNSGDVWYAIQQEQRKQED